MGDSADKHMKELNELKGARDRHARELEATKSLHESHASIDERVAFLEEQGATARETAANALRRLNHHEITVKDIALFKEALREETQQIRRERSERDIKWQMTMDQVGLTDLGRIVTNLKGYSNRLVATSLQPLSETSNR